jgi:probable FeS assembly SUF system protein SufT
MKTGGRIELKRECKAIAIPSGIESPLPAGSFVRISQMLGSSYIVITDIGYMCRIDASDADALGSNRGANQESVPSDGTFSEQVVWDQLKTIYDPEIPVNIVDLGLVYTCTIASLEDGSKNIDLKMSMTAPGCGMANILKADVERKLGQLPKVKDVQVEIVFDPPWNPSHMSEAARLQLGLDLETASTPWRGLEAKRR